MAFRRCRDVDSERSDVTTPSELLYVWSPRAVYEEDKDTSRTSHQGHGWSRTLKAQGRYRPSELSAGIVALHLNADLSVTGRPPFCFCQTQSRSHQQTATGSLLPTGLWLRTEKIYLCWRLSEALPAWLVTALSWCTCLWRDWGRLSPSSKYFRDPGAGGWRQGFYGSKRGASLSSSASSSHPRRGKQQHLIALLLFVLLFLTHQGAPAKSRSVTSTLGPRVQAATGRKHRPPNSEQQQHQHQQQQRLQLRCPPCPQVHCAVRDPRELGCPGGVTTGVCGCCPACARLAGQSCGGDLTYLGKCELGLTCVPELKPSSAPVPVHAGQGVPPGICTKVPDRRAEQSDEGFGQQCRPLCTQQYCTQKPRAVCSARNGGAETVYGCQAPCHHTSCRACAMVDDVTCVRCRGDDFRCLKQFGRCVARLRCMGAAGLRYCRRRRVKGNLGTRFVCKVPECPS